MSKLNTEFTEQQNIDAEKQLRYKKWKKERQRAQELEKKRREMSRGLHPVYPLPKMEVRPRGRATWLSVSKIVMDYDTGMIWYRTKWGSYCPKEIEEQRLLTS